MVRRVDRRTNALPDQQTNRPTNGHSILKRCFGAPKKVFDRVYRLRWPAARQILILRYFYLFSFKQVFDKESTGKVPLAEVANCLASLGEKLENEQIDKLMKILEVKEDDDGFVLYEG